MKLRYPAKRLLMLLLLLTVLPGFGFGLIVFRACPKWVPAELNPEIRKKPENPYVNPAGMIQSARILPPDGFERIPASDDSFLAFMRRQSLYPDGASVCTYLGENLPGAHAAAVYELSVGSEGYQQCADSIIRLWSEYFFSTGQTDRIAFSLTNGYKTDYESWRAGKRVIAFGNAAWSMKLAKYDDSVQQFHNYLMTVMRYAGTRSLEAESKPIRAKDARAGDLLVNGGTPGHAAVIVDEAVNAEGDRCYLLAQGFMPAQNCHIITGAGDANNPWYTEEQLSGDPVLVSSYPFNGEALRRWKEGFPNSAEK
ncbi:MAG: hypothetical protein IJL32_11930 [Oscillospiraceae bacterium]|nr:hypothetical protein [Oscillospiraceae bacterium]